MKKTFWLFLFFFGFCALSFARAGLGAAFSYNVSTVSCAEAAFSARSDESPWCVFFNSRLNQNSISLCLDDWFINERISEHADYFVLWGMSYGAVFESKETEFDMGCRFGAGGDFFFCKRRLELFAQLVWNPYFGIRKEDGELSPVFRPVNFPCSAGIRLWF